MRKKVLLSGMIFAGLMSVYSCNHPRTENEGPRMPEDREMSPHDGPASTTDTAHNDSILEADSGRIPVDPETPNF